MTSATQVVKYDYKTKEPLKGLLVLSAGFEERAFHFISRVSLDPNLKVILVKFENDIDTNEAVFNKYFHLVSTKLQKENIVVVSLRQKSPRTLLTDIEHALQNLPRDITEISLDISGMPSHAICASLYAIREFKPSYAVDVIYTSAESYHPNKKEFEILKKKQSAGVEYLPSSLAREMSENLIFNQFSGQRTNEGQSCLALFAGYEVHRSAGVIENVNPSMLLLIYGKPAGDNLQWRLELSKQLHKKFENSRKSAVEEVSTLQINESLNCLRTYYDYIYDDYDLTIAPVCSKMNSVAAYLFWEMYKEVQLIFPLPIGYSTDKKAENVGETFVTTLEPKSSLFRSF